MPEFKREIPTPAVETVDALTPAVITPQNETQHSEGRATQVAKQLQISLQKELVEAVGNSSLRKLRKLR